jgi:hypothetical protein
MEPLADQIRTAYVAEARRRLDKAVNRIRHCVGQLSEDQVWWRPTESHNSIANLLLHLCGNLRQWVVAPVVGAADQRDRPREFSERERVPREELLRRLGDVAAEADRALAGIGTSQLLEARRIQGFDETILSAIFDSLAHLTGHMQEIVYITRLQLGDAYRFDWKPQTPEQGAPKAADHAE